MSTMEIARTIQQQIGSRRMMALGATKLTALRDGGLAFKASLFGSRQCVVSVVLTPADLYNFTVKSPRSGAVIASGEGVFCEDIGPEIELAVENFFAKK